MNNTCLVLFPQTSDQLQILIFRSESIFSLNLAILSLFIGVGAIKTLFVTNLRNEKRKRKKKHEFEMT